MRRRNFRKLNGILLLDKPLGISSNKALQDARFLFQAEKAGHTGSLDPLATGMLPVCFGEASKVSAFLLDSDKRYLTTAALGHVSSTGDAEGELGEARPVPVLSPELLEKALLAFRGNIQQVPPMYSALKQNGKPLYKLARAGVEVERPARSVTIHSLQVMAYTENTLTLDVACSKGTYIRSLVEDIGEALGCGAYVSSLRRLSVTPFADYPMYAPDRLRSLSEQGQGALDAVLLPLDAALPHLQAVTLDPEQSARICQGQKLSPRALGFAGDSTGEDVRLYSEEGIFLGVGFLSAGALAPKRLMATT